jgi:hypothetical protein
MAKRNGNVNRSEEIRKLLSANPEIKPKEVVKKLGEMGIKASHALVYFVKGQIRGRNARNGKAQKTVSNVTGFAQVNQIDALSTVLKIKACASEVGGMKELKALVEALSD